MSEAWRSERRTGIAAIAGGSVVGCALWVGIRFYSPPLDGMDDLATRMLFTLYCCYFAILFCLVTGVEAVAHERLRSAAFDPLDPYRTRRLQVNRRYLQNTVEQTIVFTVGLFGLAAYSPDGDSMRAVLATTIVWILSRLAFWIGYHRSAALRGLGAPGMMIAMLVLIYVTARIGYDAAGTAGVAATIGAFLLFEGILFWGTRSPPPSNVEEPR